MLPETIDVTMVREDDHPPPRGSPCSGRQQRDRPPARPGAALCEGDDVMEDDLPTCTEETPGPCPRCPRLLGRYWCWKDRPEDQNQEERNNKLSL